MASIPKFHILATILEDFLTEIEKNNKKKTLRLVDTFFKSGLLFWISSKERLQRCACQCAHAQTLLINLGVQS